MGQGEGSVKHVYRVERLGDPSDEVQRWRATCSCGWWIVQGDQVGAMRAGRLHPKRRWRPDQPVAVVADVGATPGLLRVPVPAVRR